MQIPNVTREQKIEMIGRLIQKGEPLCARLCCKSWKIAESVFISLVRQYGSDEIKEVWIGN